jgi:hypothetical protein
VRAGTGKQKNHQGHGYNEPHQGRRKDEALGVHRCMSVKQGLRRSGSYGRNAQRYSIGRKRRQASASVLDGEFSGGVKCSRRRDPRRRWGFLRRNSSLEGAIWG